MPLRQSLRSSALQRIAAMSPVVLPLLLTGFIATVAVAQVDGTLYAPGVTIPHGIVWLPGALGGHVWVGMAPRDSTQSPSTFCRLDAGSSLGLPGLPFAVNPAMCQSDLISAGQPVYDPRLVVTSGNLTTTFHYVYVPDIASASDIVDRHVFDPSTETLVDLALNVETHFQVVIPTGPVPIGLLTGATLGPDGNLYLSTSTGLVLRVQNVNAPAITSPLSAAIVATASDGSQSADISKGISGLTMGVGNLLYIAERGGSVSRFDITQCGPPAPPCTAAPVTPKIAITPGAIAADPVNKMVYVADAPASAAGSILRYDVSNDVFPPPSSLSLVIETYSNAVPAYTSQFDGVVRTQYINPLALGTDFATRVFIGDDPVAALPIPILPANQGHIWTVPLSSGGPAVASVSPATGPPAGGDVVTVSLQRNLGVPNSTTPFSVTSILFGTTPATGIACTFQGGGANGVFGTPDDTGTCTATTPPGSGTVDVRVVISESSPLGVTTALVTFITPLDRFTYDGTPPTTTASMTPAPNAAGWNKSPVTVTLTATDNTGGSGVRQITYTLNGAQTVVAGNTASFAVSTEGTSTIMFLATDNAGNAESPNSATVKIDLTPPTINIFSPKGTYLLNQSGVVANYSCPDALSGTASCVGTLPLNASVSTAAPGSFTFSVNAADVAGNTSSASSTYTVDYAPAGTVCFGDAGHQILQPINADGTSIFKQGSTVPAKFRVCDANGLSIGTAGVVSSFNLVQIISGTESTSVNEVVDSTNADTAFRFDPTAQQWIFNVSTKGLSAKKTYVFQIVLNDGSSIFFQFGLR